MGSSEGWYGCTGLGGGFTVSSSESDEKSASKFTCFFPPKSVMGVYPC